MLVQLYEYKDYSYPRLKSMATRKGAIRGFSEVGEAIGLHTRLVIYVNSVSYLTWVHSIRQIVGYVN